MSRSASPENDANAREELHVVQSPSIPFPAPATPIRSQSQRSAARAATSSMKKKQQENTTDEEGMTTASEPDLTNDETADSWSAGEGETDETMHEEEDDDASIGIPTEDESPPPPRSARKRKTPAKKKATAAAMAKASDGEEDVTPAAAGSSPPAKKRKTASTTKKSNGKAKKAAAENGVTSKDFIGDDHDQIDTGIQSDSSGLTPAEELSENQEEVKPKRKRKAPSKPRKPRAPKPEPIYVIPDVEKKPNPGYQGRLGYACLNTILRKKKPLPIFCSRTCRIDTIKKNGMDFLKELGRTNIKDLIQLIEWNEANNIRFMRLSSEMFPFASHGEYGYTLEYADKELKEAGDLVKKYGHRVTTHPGQFTQLGSPRPIVVSNAVKDLVYHCEMLDRMGMDQDSVMIIHGGGTFQDKAATIERIKQNYNEKLPDNVKARVVLENDEMCYNVDDLLPVCEELNIPLVLDYHHDWIFPRAEKSLEELMPRILATWERKGIKPKFHLSEPRPGAVTVMERRAHSDRCKNLPTPLPSHVDLMIEAKDKEQAVLELYRIYDLQPVHHDSLRPPAEVETLHTQGRKSSKKKKAKAAAEEGEEGIEEAVDPDEAMLDVEGAEVAPPVEGTNAKKAKTPAKRGRAKKDTAAVKEENGEAGEEGEEPKSAAKKKAATPRKSRAKKPTAADAATATAEVTEERTEEADEGKKKLEEQVRAEPPEAEPIEDMKMKEVPEPVVDAVPCEASTAPQENKAI